jgi:flagellar biosynthetic protein FlhB
MDDNELDKSEQPTPFKLDRARKKGTVARGADLGYLVGLAAFLACAALSGPHLAAALAQAVRVALVEGPTLPDGASVVPLGNLLFSSVAHTLALTAATIFCLVLVFELVQTGFIFSAQPLKPDFSRLNPAKGLKRIFTVRLLIETLKNVLKVAAYAAVAYFVIREAVTTSAGSLLSAKELLLQLATAGIRLVAAFVALAAGFAILDQLIVRRDFRKKMRMSRRELRQEMRDREGEPRLKQKRKQMHSEFVKLAQSVRNIRKADLLITNPEHIAIALRYDRGTMHAPVAVSIGTNHLAQRLKRLAFIYGIPIIDDPELARELHRRTVLNGPIPEHCYQLVANVYNAVRRAAQEKQSFLERPVRSTDV